MKPFITTYTGRKVNPLALEVSDICVEDIGHHLSLINRFVGASQIPVPTSQHSWFVSKLLDGTGWEAEGLFHDAGEAYLGDISKWVKRMPEMAGYCLAEGRAWEVICAALKLRPEGSPERNLIVEEADRLMVRVECLYAIANPSHLFSIPTHPTPTSVELERVGKWHPWSWKASRFRFLHKAGKLGFR